MSNILPSGASARAQVDGGGSGVLANKIHPSPSVDASQPVCWGAPPTWSTLPSRTADAANRPEHAPDDALDDAPGGEPGGGPLSDVARRVKWWALPGHAAPAEEEPSHRRDAVRSASALLPAVAAPLGRVRDSARRTASLGASPPAERGSFFMGALRASSVRGRSPASGSFARRGTSFMGALRDSIRGPHPGSAWPTPHNINASPSIIGTLRATIRGARTASGSSARAPSVVLAIPRLASAGLEKVGTYITDLRDARNQSNLMRRLASRKSQARHCSPLPALSSPRAAGNAGCAGAAGTRFHACVHPRCRHAHPACRRVLQEEGPASRDLHCAQFDLPVGCAVRCTSRPITGV